MANTPVNDNLDGFSFTPGIVMVDKDTFYYFFVDEDDDDPKYTKSADGGATWATAVTMGIFTVSAGLGGIWYDRWTPGDTSGTKIYIAHWDKLSGNDLFYQSLNTSGDSLGTNKFIAELTTASARITKAVGGNLYIWTPDTFVRSTDGGANWGGRTQPPAIAGGAFLFPAQWRDDDADIAMIAANSSFILNLYEYDDSANTWSTTAIYTPTGGATSDLAVTLRQSDGHLIMVHKDEITQWTDIDLRTFDIAASITEKTKVALDVQSGFNPTIMVADNDDILFAYSVGATRQTGEYRTSTDGGTTWSGATTFTEGVPATSYTRLTVPYNLPGGGIFAPIFVDVGTTPDTAFINLVNAVEFAAAAAATIAVIWVTQQRRVGWKP